jgi:hypothetical protein
MIHVYCLLIATLPFISSFAQSQVVDISHYIFPEFTNGVILLKSGIECQSLLNYNSLTEEMVFEEKGKRLAISEADFNNIDTVYLGGRKFALFNNRFIELIHHSKFDLYIEHKCMLKLPGQPAAYGGTTYTSAINSYAAYFSDGKIYDLKLPDGYTIKPYFNYWLKRNDVFHGFINMKQLKDLYPDKKDLFKAYLKKQDIKYTNQPGIVQLIEYLETNGEDKSID